MEFRDYATTQSSELVARLLGNSTEQSRRQLQRLRSALDDAVGALEAALETPPQVDRDIEEVASGLTQAALRHAEEQVARAVEPLHAEISAHTDEIALLAGSLEESQGHADALQNDLDATRGELENTRTQLDNLRAQHDDLRGQLEDTRTQLEDTRTQLEDTRTQFEDTRAQLEDTRTQLEEAVTDRARFEDAAAVANSQAEAAEAKLEAVTSLFATSNSRIKVLERAQHEHDRIVRNLQAKLQAQGNAPAAPTAPAAPDRSSLSLLDELLGGFEALSAATTITDVLTTITEQLAADFNRVALFRVKGNKLEGEHQIGIDSPSDISKVVLPLGMDSMLTRAANTGQLMALSGSDLADSSRAPFTGAPTSALALPIAVNGETLAVVYADDFGQAENDRSPINLDRSSRMADALRQHAVALLTRLTGEMKMLAELRAYADLLLTEMEQMYNADVAAGQSGEALLNLLISNLEYARSIYASRVTHEGADAATLLEDRISTLLDTRADTPFGRDLATALSTAEKDSESRAPAGA